MNQSELYKVFKDVLGWHGQSIRFLILFITSLIKVRSLNLSQIGEGFDNDVELSSNYRRIQRFLQLFEMDLKKVALLISKFLPDGKWVLCMDRTDWKFGKIPINLLFLSVACKGVAIPLFVTILTKKGNSNTQERKDIILRFIELFGVDNIDFLAGDREFIGKEWFKWLIGQEIKFNMRIKDNFLIPNSKGQLKQVKYFFSQVEITRIMSKKLFGLNIKLIGKRLIDGEYIIIATNSDLPNLNEYAKRWLLSLVEVWKIELMFSAFKIRGFNFESTKVTQPEKLEKLIALLSITFCWAYAVGEVRNKEKPITFRQDLNTLSKSIFHYGLEFIRTAFLNPIHKHTSIVKSIKILLSYIQGSSCFVVE